MGDMEISTAARKKENADFLEAEDEMAKAVKALDSAIDVLGQATKAHKKGVLMAVRARLNGGMQAFAEQQFALKHAAELGDRFLDKADSFFLKRLLSGDVPKVDWTKTQPQSDLQDGLQGSVFQNPRCLEKVASDFHDQSQRRTI